MKFTYDDRHYVSLFHDAWHFLPSQANVTWFKGLRPEKKQELWDDLLNKIGLLDDR